MAMVWEYQVWQVQNARVLWVNGEWNGDDPLDMTQQEESMASCPMIWEALQQAGKSGWELVGTLNLTEGHNGILYLKRDQDR